ncbi:MAG TPA: hypothetical protein VGI59_05025 [Candidatus Udaeobacter sp.]|jgi:hypothetical protein
MRFLAVVVGTLLGMVAGLAIALLVAVVFEGNDLWSVMWTGLWVSPIGLTCGGMIGAVVGLLISPHLRERETKQIRWTTIFISLGVSSSAILILTSALFCVVRSGMTAPSDQKLLANFERHEATFNALIEMLNADEGLIRVDEDWTDPKSPAAIAVSSTRIATYRQMLREARVPRGFQAKPLMYEVDFFYWTIGSAISSDTTKGYAYRTHPPIETLSSLDGYRTDPKNGDDTIKVYRHIHGNWYLFFEYIPG